MTLDRRRLVLSAAGLAVGGIESIRLLAEEMLLRDRRPQRSRVAVLSAEQYSERLVATFWRKSEGLNSLFSVLGGCVVCMNAVFHP
jgi:hypothetical protein